MPFKYERPSVKEGYMRSHGASSNSTDERFFRRYDASVTLSHIGKENIMTGLTHFSLIVTVLGLGSALALALMLRLVEAFYFK
jgi:hypothetical protein